jgi:DNA-binding GntR family transcriptional regulator
MTEKDVWEAYTLKAALYELAMELAMSSIDTSQIRELEAIVQRMEKCVQAEPVDLLGYQGYHRDFHNQIMVISGHQRLKKIAASIHNQVSRFSYQSLQNKKHLDSSVHYHRQILAAIKDRKDARACMLMKEHVLKAIDAFRESNAYSGSD